MTLPSHQGRTAVITGAAQGIGRAIATCLAERGAQIVLVDCQQPIASQAALEEMGARVSSVVADVSEENAWAKIAEHLQSRGGADVLVNNAGIYPFADIDNLSYDIWSRVFRVNLDSMFFGVKALLGQLRASGRGRIVNISSNSIGTNLPGLSHYMASKMGVIGFTRGLANDLAGDGITVNAICPAITRTPGTAGLADEVLIGVSRLQAIKKLAEPADIVGPIAFLTSDAAAFVTGQTLVVDGGMLKL